MNKGFNDFIGCAGSEGDFKRLICGFYGWWTPDVIELLDDGSIQAAGKILNTRWEVKRGRYRLLMGKASR